MTLWLVGGLASLLIAGAYLSIAWIIQGGLTRTRQWRRNPLGVATFCIFLTCGVGHALHAEHLLVGAATADATGLALREVFGVWHVILVELFTGGVAIWYLSQRRRYGALLSVAVFEDVDERQRTALEVNDDIIQGLVTARLALDLDDPDEARRGLDHALEASREVMDRLLEPVNFHGGVRGGDLRRRTSAKPS